jgi:uncharacterized protein YjbI with pentapeptide repeats
MTEQFTIERRPGWKFRGAVTVTIECDPLASTGVKIGLAVQAAVKSGANLTGAELTRADLTGAYLTGAELSLANLTGAELTGADLSGAELTRAKINGEPVTRCFARVMRDDGYGFLAFTLEAGGVKVMAGCRWFAVAEFRAHVAAKYPDTEKATETLWILDAIERRAADLGISLEPVAATEAVRLNIAEVAQ